MGREPDASPHWHLQRECHGLMNPLCCEQKSKLSFRLFFLTIDAHPKVRKYVTVAPLFSRLIRENFGEDEITWRDATHPAPPDSFRDSVSAKWLVYPSHLGRNHILACLSIIKNALGMRLAKSTPKLGTHLPRQRSAGRAKYTVHHGVTNSVHVFMLGRMERSHPMSRHCIRQAPNDYGHRHTKMLYVYFHRVKTEEGEEV